MASKTVPEPHWRERVVFAYLDEPPFCAPGPFEKPIGCDVEVGFAILEQLNVRRIETRLVTFAELLPGVADGLWTINTPLFVTPERRQVVEFSKPVWSLADGLLVRKGNPRNLVSYEALAADRDAMLGVVADQVQEQAALRAGVPANRVIRFATQREVVQALLNRQVDAYASVAMAHRGFLRRYPDDRLEVVDLGTGRGGGEGTAAAIGGYSFAKANAGLREAFDDCLGGYLGSPPHRRILETYGFAASDIARVAAR